MDREKAIDWIYGERLIQPTEAKPPSNKRTTSEDEHRSPLWLLRHRLQLWQRFAVHDTALADIAAMRSRWAEQMASRAWSHSLAVS